MSNENDIRNRQEELSAIPPRNARPEDWPKGVRMIGLDEMDALGVDANGALYWHGKSVAVRRIELRSMELVLATIATVGTLMSGLAALFPQLPKFMELLF